MPLQQITSADIASLPSGSVSNTTFATGAVESYLNTQGTSFGFRNKIINGAMVIDQRNAGGSINNDTTGTQYSVDRWLIYGTQASKFSAQQSTDAPAGFSNSLKLTSSSAYTLNGTDTFHLTQRIEGYNIADLAWGTASAKTATLSFWVKSSLTGTFTGVIKNNGTDYNYPFTYTIVNSNTWQQVAITIAAPTAGTWLTNNGTGMGVRFGLASNYTSTPGTWTSSYTDAATGQTSLVGTNGATFYITGVQLEKGSTATAFEYRDYGRELIMCWRYYQRPFGNNVQLPFGIMNQGTMSVQWQPPVPFRATPSLDQIAGSLWRFNGYTSGENFANTWTLNGANATVIFMSPSAVPTSGNGYAVSSRAYDTSNYLGFSAEL